MWLNTLDISLTDIRLKISELLKINSNDIKFESGKGNLIDNIKQNLINILQDNNISYDFFGFITATCYISIIPTDDTHIKSNERIIRRQSTFLSLLSNNNEILYHESYVLTAKIPAYDVDTKAFYINVIDKFAGATPIQPMINHTIKLLPWIDTNTDSDNTTDEPSVASNHTNKTKSSISTWGKKILPNIGIQKDHKKHIKNGDMIVIENNNKYLSIAGGWWLAWSSNHPKKSGVFIIEIIDRAPLQNKLTNQIKESFENIKEKIRRPTLILNNLPISTSTNSPTANNNNNNNSFKSTQLDDLLRSGDSFRLRSLKFPGYEIGITNSKLNDSYCYLGIRKIDDKVTLGSEWCMQVQFSLK